ncbi:unnamed protein product, partial [Ceratitis capitata]
MRRDICAECDSMGGGVAALVNFRRPSSYLATSFSLESNSANPTDGTLNHTITGEVRS